MNRICSSVTLVAITCFAPIPALALSDDEAAALIEAEMTARAEREADRRADLLEIPAVQEWTRERAGQRTVFRQIAPPVKSEPGTARIAVPAEKETVGKMEERRESPPAALKGKSMSLTLFVTVFDDELTEIRVAPLADGITVLSNVPFTHLPAMESVTTEDAYYSFFSLVDHVGSDFGTSSDRPDSTVFSAIGPDYVVFVEGEAEVSADLLDAIDSLHRHYLKHEAEYEATAQRAEALRAARERYLETHPPQSEETVINFFPIRSRIHATENQ